MSRFRVNLLGSVLAWAVIICSLIWFAMRSIESGDFSRRVIVGSAFLLVAMAAVVYSAYMLYRLDRFFRRWGKRFEHLEGVERELLGE
jgi:type VI protein secretion system component VasK